MNRSEAIAVIAEKLASIDDEGMRSLAQHAEDLSGASTIRPLTSSELGLLARAAEDAEHGRTLSLDEARAQSDQLIRSWRVKYPDAP